MFRPGWRGGSRQPPVKPPPIVHVYVELSSRWQDPKQQQLLVIIASELVDLCQGSINQFINAHRQHLSLSRQQQYRVSTSLVEGAIKLMFTANQQTETIDITVYPDILLENSTLTSLARYLEVLSGIVLDISVPFVTWPLPAYSFATAGGGTGFWTGPFYGNYYYDPYFTPLPVTASSPTTDDQQLGLLPNLSGDVPLGWFPTDFEPSGAQWDNVKVGGSGICTVPIVGQQYWEVVIVKLPPSGTVPPTITATQVLSGVSDASSYTDPTFTYDIPAGTDVTKTVTWSWPSALDTWMSPAIGLVPKNFLDPSWKANTVSYGGVIGLDYDPSQPRSIGAVRTSLTTGAWSSSTTTVGAGTLAVSSTTTYFYTNSVGSSVALEIGGTSYTSIDQTTPPSGSQTWNVGDIVGAGNYLCMCIGTSASGSSSTPLFSGTGPAAGPSATDAASYWSAAPVSASPDFEAMPASIAVGGVFFVVVGTTTNGLTNASSLPFSAYLTGNSFNTSAWIQAPSLGTITASGSGDTTVTGSGTKPFGDVFLAADALEMDGVTLKQSGVNSLGRHTPVFLGRADGLVATQTHAQTATPAAAVPPAGATIGVWSGVDLGDLQEKDVIMVAADTKTRGVWFGKNGQWYDTSGPSSLQPPDMAPAVLMDGDDTVHYYPAASWRFGPTHLQMALSALIQTYTAPGAFTAYTPDNPPVIVPLG